MRTLTTEETQVKLTRRRRSTPIASEFLPMRAPSSTTPGDTRIKTAKTPTPPRKENQQNPWRSRRVGGSLLGPGEGLTHAPRPFRPAQFLGIAALGLVTFTGGGAARAADATLAVDASQ